MSATCPRASSASTRRKTTSRTTASCPRKRRCSTSSRRPRRRSAPCTSPPTLTAKARRSAGISPRSWAWPRPRRTGSCSTRSRSGRSRPPSSIPARSTSIKWTRSRRGVSSTGWWATSSRRCSGRRSVAGSQPGVCSPSRCGSSPSVSARSWPSSPSSTGRCTRVSGARIPRNSPRPCASTKARRPRWRRRPPPWRS